MIEVGVVGACGVLIGLVDGLIGSIVVIVGLLGVVSVVAVIGVSALDDHHPDGTVGIVADLCNAVRCSILFDSVTRIHHDSHCIVSYQGIHHALSW